MIKVRNLTKKFGSIKALKGIDFDISENEIYGLLGPNGAGKSTTINILSTILKPDTGELEINNYNLKSHTQACKQSIGVVPQEISLYDELSAIDNLLFWGSLYNIKASVLKEKANSLLELFGLSDRKNDKIKNYSGGMKRRINIASALLHSPKVLLMDEPTVGIDPQSRNMIFEVTEKLNKEGLTIVYTTHYMEEAERLCNRIGIIDQGKIIAEGTLNELRKLSKTSENIIININGDSVDKIQKLKETLKIKFTFAENSLNIFSDHANADLPYVITKINEIGIKIKNIDIIKANLETVFLNLTGKNLRN